MSACYIVAKTADKFAKFAERVWEIAPSGKSEAELANAGIDALAAFIQEKSNTIKLEIFA